MQWFGIWSLLGILIATTTFAACSGSTLEESGEGRVTSPHPTELAPNASVTSEPNVPSGTEDAETEITNFDEDSEIWHEGYATPSVGLRVWEADVVVHANLVSVDDKRFLFRAVEYLKGTGAEEFAATVPAGMPLPQPDQRPAILILRASADGSGENVGTPENATDFQFWSITDDHYYSGKLPYGFTIDARDPLWLPASDTDGQSPGQFITNAKSPLGPIDLTISLQELRDMIAWQGKESTTEYRACVAASLYYEQYYRDEAFYFGPQGEKESFRENISSGAATGEIIYESSFWRGDSGYPRTWLTGEDASFFKSETSDDDDVASNGFVQSISTSRPLASGTYRFVDHAQLARYMPCQYIPVYSYLRWLITVTAPTGTLHEAFFDPVTIGSTVGVDNTNGVLRPRTFIGANGASATIERITWESGTVTLAVTPDNALAAHVVDVIKLDGSISLSLNVANATVDSAKDTLSWTVSPQPWESGDLLMIRIREVG